MKRLRRLRVYLIAVLVPLCLTILFGASTLRLREQIRDLVFDEYQRLSPRRADPDSPVRIVDIDDESLRRIGQWPWPRNRIAALVNGLAERNVAAIGFDLLFSESDHNSLESLLKELPASRALPLLQEELAAQESNDQIFARSLRDRPVVLGAVLTNGRDPVAVPSKSGVVTAGDDPKPFLVHFPSAVVPLPMLSENAAGIAALNWLPDRDRIVRRVPLIMATGDSIVPGLAIDALRVAQGASTYVIKSSNASGEQAFGAQTGINAIKVGDVVVPTDAAGDIQVHFSESQPSRYVPAWKVVTGAVSDADLAGKIVFVGSSASALGDVIATPLTAGMPGVEVHAQLIEQMLSGETLVRPDWAPGAEFAAALLLCAVFIVALPMVSAVWSAVGGAAVVALMAGTSWLAFVRGGLLIDPVFPSIWPGAVFLAGILSLYGMKRQQEREIRSAFGRFVSPAIVARLAEHPENLRLGGEDRQLTLMFCDLRSFTTVSEGLSAQDLTRFLNEYLTPMTDVILDRLGTVDKYMGDAIMAFWNAPLDDPDHARHSAETALAMRETLATLNAGWQAEGRKLPIVRFGVGLNTGEACVGNLGSVRRFDYSVIGDEVNVASRLEAASKYFGVDIVASEATRLGAPDFAWLKVDDVLLKGKTKPVAVYTLAGDTAYAASADFGTLRARHDTMLSAYAARDFDEAARLASEAEAGAPDSVVGLYGFHRQRFEALRGGDLGPDWTAMTVLDEK